MLSFNKVKKDKFRRAIHWLTWTDDEGQPKHYPLQVMIRRETALLHIGYWDRALESALKNLEAAEASGSARDIANCRYNLAGFRGRRGEHDQSMELYRQAKTYFDETGNRLRVHLALWNIGNVFKSQGQREEALDCYRRSLEVFLDAGLYNEASVILGDMGELQSKAGDPRAGEYFQRAIDLSRKHYCLRGLSDALYKAASACRADDPQRALEMCREALALNRQTGDLRGMASVYGKMGEIALSLGDHRQAGADFERVRQVSLALNDRNGVQYAEAWLEKLREEGK